jgi:hypothetical protein
MATKKEPIEHKDLLGNPITLESKLAVSHRNSLKICSILKITPKMMRVKPLFVTSYWRDEDGYLVYSDQCVVVDGPDVLAYMLRGE